MTNRRNYTNFERNLAMMVIYHPIKFEFDWTKRFRVKSPETKMWMARWTDVGHINLIDGLVTTCHISVKKNSIRDVRTPKPGEIAFSTMRCRSSKTLKRSG